MNPLDLKHFLQGVLFTPNVVDKKTTNGVRFMDVKIKKFLQGETNVVETKLVMTRETTPAGMQYIRILADLHNDRVLLYDFWHNPQKNDKKTEIIKDESLVVEKPPKHTGGKKPYLMLMIDEIEKLKASVPNTEELIGYVSCLGKYIEWNTGKLIHKRSKKPIQYKDLLEIYKCSNKKLNKMIALMKKHNLLEHNSEGYFISSKYIKKGKSKKRDDNDGEI